MNIAYKTNKQFMLMTFFGILFMLDDHSGNFIGFFANLFPYNSFYMPMFFFISGYFYNPFNVKSNFKKYIKHKIKRLVFPFIAANLFTYFTVYVFNFFFGLQWKTHFSLNELLFFLSTGTVIDLSSSTWFLISLFESLIVYAAIRTLFFQVWDDFGALIIYILISCISVYFATKGYSKNYIWLPMLKIGFFSVYLQLGQFFRKFESFIMKHIPVFFLFSIIANILILSIYSQKEICFNSLAFMQGFQTTNYILPFLTSVTGIFFYYGLSKIVSSSLGTLYFVNLISNNSLYILCFHLLFFNILNGFFSINGNMFGMFDWSKFSNTAWYIYDNQIIFKFYYCVIGLIGSLCLAKIIDVIKLLFSNSIIYSHY